MKILRPYQNAAEVSLFKYLFEKKGNPLVVAPVAAGKSLMIANFIKELHNYYPRTRVVKLTHVKELLTQNAEELLEQYSGVDMGFYCAGLGQKRLHNDVTFASIQSVHNKIANFNRVPEVIIIDECHLISHKESTTYRKFIDSVLQLNPKCRVIGYTGTPFRADTGRLDEGENKLFDNVAYEISMGFMIEQGYWAKPVCPEIATKIDVSGVSVRGGDYVAGQLQDKVNTHEVNDACVKEMIEKGQNRRKWLVFTAGIQHAEDVTNELRSAGIEAAFVTGETPLNERNQIIQSFRDGKIRCLVNVAVLTTGFNVPDIDLLAFMRPTRSPVLYIQTIGRGVRPVYADGYDLNELEGRLSAIANSIKPDCMVLDFGNVVGTLGPIDQVSIRKKYTGEKEKNEAGEAITKICPSCGAECAAAQRYCYACSYCFIELDEKAGNKAIMSTDVEPEWVEVLGMFQNFHQTENSWQPSMKVTYSTMLGTVREWICFQHWKADVGEPKRYAWNKAVEWHKNRMPNEDVPKEIDQAVSLEYPTPSRILIRPKGKYFEVLDYEFEQTKSKSKEPEDEFEIPF